MSALDWLMVTAAFLAAGLAAWGAALSRGSQVRAAANAARVDQLAVQAQTLLEQAEHLSAEVRRADVPRTCPACGAGMSTRWWDPLGPHWVDVCGCGTHVHPELD